jgi:proteasome lid subunit RPN8/RPN11
MLVQASAELPNECCGLLAGRIFVEEAAPAVGEVVRCYPLVNAAASPREYLSDPKSLFAAVRDIRRQELEILAVYHSHPSSEPIPSRTDLERNYSPEVANFIISLKEGEPEMRGWWLSGEEYVEADWELTL